MILNSNCDSTLNDDSNFTDDSNFDDDFKFNDDSNLLMILVYAIRLRWIKWC